MNTITVNINRVDLDVTFSYWTCHPAFSDTADGVEIEIECISLDGKTVDTDLAAHVVEKIYQKVRAAISADSQRQDEAKPEAKIDAALAYLGGA